MIDFVDRISARQGVYSLKREDGSEETVTLTLSDDPIVQGTPLNRSNMMALQGFEETNVYFNADGSITQINPFGHTFTTEFKDNKVIQTFFGEKTIKKTTTFNPNDGSISEVIE
ncbi:MAG: hypothetical protein U0M06_02165 [Clostridia bacterium]|nr:hypothetical protein [Clostridia bacterium]